MKTIKQKIFDKLDKDCYMTDQDLFRLYDKEPNFCVAEEYKRQWRRLQGDRKFFEDKKIIETKQHRRLRIVTVEDGTSYRVGKDYFNEITKQ